MKLLWIKLHFTNIFLFFLHCFLVLVMWEMEKRDLKSELAVQFCRGIKGPKLLLGGFSYFRNNGNGDRTYWLCSKNRYHKCNARLITKTSSREVIIKNQEHNHGTDPEDLRSLIQGEKLSFDSVMNYLKVVESDLYNIKAERN